MKELCGLLSRTVIKGGDDECRHAGAAGIAFGGCDSCVVWCPECGAITLQSDGDIELIERRPGGEWRIPARIKAGRR